MWPFGMPHTIPACRGHEHGALPLVFGACNCYWLLGYDVLGTRQQTRTLWIHLVMFTCKDRFRKPISCKGVFPALTTCGSSNAYNPVAIEVSSATGNMNLCAMAENPNPEPWA